MRALLLLTASASVILSGCGENRSPVGDAARSRYDAERAGTVPGAMAELKNAQGVSVGTAMLTETPAGVNVRVAVTGVTPGQHGIHVHQIGRCIGPDFKSAGDHFNPTGQHHGAPNAAVSHAGDLGNINVASDGTGNAQLTMKNLTIAGGAKALLREGGTSVVLHAQTDDLKTDPSGNSGDRIACGDIHSTTRTSILP